MTTGIKVIWLDEKGKVDEIEYFPGIDVDNLERIPKFGTVTAVWPQYKEEPSVEYNIDVRCERKSEQEVHLIVAYDEASNLELNKRYPEIYWGINTIILKRGKRRGHCRWLRHDAKKPEKVAWEAFDLDASHGRPRATYLGSRRQAHFRNMILTRDGHRCVLTKEQTSKALEATHLIPAKNGENDMPFNGIALREDLHRLFDAHLFTFRENGLVKITDAPSQLSVEYREILQNKRLPRATFERVKATLALESFQSR